ncbi:MAG: penicillin-binding transpeptidase domain-containing protein [Lachnospirales bacterium]
MQYLTKILQNIYKFFSNRIIILIGFMTFAFLLLIGTLYNLQIIQGEYYLRNLRESTVKTLDLSAPRGEIYDKYGLPLAVNETAFGLTMDPQVSLTTKELNDVIYNIILLLDENGESFVDELPISTTTPYVFTIADTRVNTWKTDMGFSQSRFDYDATESFYYLLENFDIIESDEDGNYTSDYPEEYWRSMLSIKSSHYAQRFRKYNSITLANNVSVETVSAVEERPDLYESINSSVTATREYPTSEFTSHIIGYIMKISESEYETYSKENPDYTANDLVGKDGLEKYFELDLKGESGTQTVELNNVGKITQVIDEEAPVTGNNIYTTIDSDLTEDIYNKLEEYLKNLIIANMTTTRSNDTKITTNDFFYNFARANNFLLDQIFELDESTSAYKVYNKTCDYYNGIMAEYEALSQKARDNVLSLTNDDKDKLDTYSYYLDYSMDSQSDFSIMLGRAIKNKDISEQELLLAMEDLGIVTYDERTKEKILNGYFSTQTILISKLNSGEITPQMTNLDPSTGSVMVVDVNSGDIISSVSYPSYDNNKLVNNFDNDYYYKISQLDPTTPLLNRAFVEGRAPGSTFKMLSAISILEDSNMTPTSTIYDNIYFKDAGQPYIKCWSNVSHGHVDVCRALEVSCNYYFLKSVYDMGNSASGTSDVSINSLNKYMTYFGFNEGTGAEVTELADFSPEGASLISSPEYKRTTRAYNYPDLDESELAWYDGDTVASSIGQGYNNYTAASMAKYVATLANGGNRYPLHFLNKITDEDENVVVDYEPVVEEVVPISDETYAAVLQGMKQVVTGSEGTGKTAFGTFPIEIAAKTGTAQQVTNRSDHSSFAAFAPADDPEVAIYVLLPFGNSYNFSSPASKLARDVLDEYFKLNYEPELVATANDNYFTK